MKILMFAHGGSLNRGCEAIVRSSTALIKNKLQDSKVFLASSMPETDQAIQHLDAIYDGADRPIKKFSLDWWIASLQYKLFNNDSYSYGKIMSNVIRHVKDADICLSVGGDNYCYGEQPALYEVNKQVKLHGKKLVLWGCSIGKEDMSAKKLEDLRRYDLILARESLTYEMLTDFGLNVRRCADPAFTMDKELLPLPEGWQEQNTIGLNFSPLVWKLNEESRQAVQQLIDHILKATDMTIALTPHVIQQGNDDYEIMEQFYEQYRDTERVLLLPNNLNALQYKGYISQMRFFIGARTHATIAAYSSYVPTMVLGYSVKSKGIARDLFEQEKLVLDLADLSDASKLQKMFDEMVQEEAWLINRLKIAVPQMKQLSARAVQYLEELAV